MQEIITTFGIDWRLLIIQALNFGALLFLLWLLLYRPVLRMLEKRQALIKEGVEAAEASKEEHSRIEGERQSIIARAIDEGEQLLLNARERAKEEESSIVTGAHKRGEDIIKEAEERAAEEVRRRREEAREETARLAVLAAERILKEHA